MEHDKYRLKMLLRLSQQEKEDLYWEIVKQTKQDVLNQCRKELDNIKVMVERLRKQPYILIAYADVMIMFDKIELYNETSGKQSEGE